MKAVKEVLNRATTTVTQFETKFDYLLEKNVRSDANRIAYEMRISIETMKADRLAAVNRHLTLSPRSTVAFDLPPR